MPGIRTVAATGALLLAYAHPKALPAQAPDTLGLDSARALTRAGRYLEARPLLAAALGRCAKDAAGAACRHTVNFERGFLAQTAAADSGGGPPLLDEAEAAYRAVLADAPGHEAARENLSILFAQRDPAGLNAEQLEAAFRADTLRRGVYLLLLGDRLAASGDSASAWGTWRRAVGEPGAGEQPLQRLVLLYSAGAGDASELLRFLRVDQARSPEAAEVGYLRVMERTRRTAPALADSALVRWAALRAARGGLASGFSAELPEDLRTAAVRELDAYLTAGCNGEAEWWTAGDERTEVLARAALARGRDLLAEERPSDALACWFNGFRTAPESMAALDLAREVAIMVYRHPALDPEGSTLRWVEDALFGVKAGFIESGDLEAQQRVHTALASIYTERGQWGPRTEPRTAVFQLERALRAAARRDSEGGFYQPLPQLRMQLARGLRALGDSAGADLRALDAARAFLDSDAPESAREALSGIAASASRDSVAEVAAMAAFRERLARAEEGSGTESPADVCAPGVVGTAAPASAGFAIPLSAKDVPWSGSGFLTRQRFKILADCTGAVKDPLRVAYAAEAIRLAAAPAARGLVGAADVARFQRSTAVVLEGATVSSDEAVIRTTRPTPLERASVAAIGVTSDGDPSYLWVNRERIRAAIATRLAGPLGYSVWAVDNVLVVRGGGDSRAAKNLRDRIQVVTGATEVRVERPPPAGP